jgi:flagellar biosynthesis regulator FlbT
MTDRNFKTFKIEYNTPEEAEKFFNDPKVIRKLVQIENSTLKTIKKEKRDGYCVSSYYNLARILRISYVNQKTLKIEEDICTPDEITQFLAKIYSNQLLPLLKNGSLNCLTFVKQIRSAG